MRTILALLAMLSCAQALAQTDTTALPDVVITATRIPIPTDHAPAGTTVVTRQDIADRGYNSLADALSDVTGLRVSQSGSLGGQTSIFIRGTNSNHVLVLRDGLPIADPSEPSDAYNFGVDTLSDIDRIEVVRGPMAAVYGSGAIGGVINLISRRGTEPGIHWEGDLSGGYPATIRGAISASGVLGRWDFAATVASQSQQGFDSTPQRMTSYTGTPQGFRDRVASLNLGFTPIDGTRLSLFLRGREATFGFNTLGTPTFDAANSTGKTDSVLGRIGVASTLFGMWDTNLFVGHQREDRHYTEPLIAADPNGTSLDDRYHSQRTSVQWNNTVRLDPTTAATFGWEHFEDTIHVRTSDNFGGFPFAQSARASMASSGLHVGLQSTLWDRLTLSGQIRRDWIAGQEPTTWRAGAAFDATEIATVFKAAYGTAFRAPSLFERFGVDSFGYQGNPSLKAERAGGWDVGFATTVPAFGRRDFLSFGTTYFNEQVDNLIVNVFSPVDTSINIGSAHLQGFETELSLRPGPWLTLRLSHTYTEALNASDGTRLLRRPQHAGSAMATIRPMPELRIVPSVKYTGAFRDVLYDNGGNSLGRGVGQQGLVANLSASYDLIPGLTLYAVGKNLAGSRFESVNGFQIPGTAVLVGIRLSIG